MKSLPNSLSRANSQVSAYLFNWRKLFAVVLVLAFAGLPGIANAQMDFEAAVDYSVGQTPDGIASGDFDGDGDKDMAVVSDGITGNLDLIEIFLNDADGNFTAGGTVILPNSSSPTEIVAADLDGDSDVDLAVILRDLQQIQVVTNTGGGAFVLGSTVAVGDRARGMTSGDYDFDNDVDLAVANRNDDTATVLTNNGAGVFSPLTLAIGGETRAVAFIDIDGNNDLDLAVTNNDDRNVALFTNSGTGFSPAGTISTGPIHRPEGIVAADLDGNGLQDLAVAINDDAQPDAAMVFLNLGGSFGAGTPYLTSGTNTSGIVAADLDCDGALDLITRDEDSNNLSLLPNLGGTFGAPMPIATGLNPSQMVALDLDNDGDTEIAVTNRDSNSFSVFSNNCSVGFFTVMPESFLVTLGTYVSGSIGDLNASDDVDLTVLSPALGTIIEFEFKGFSPVANPTMLAVSLEGSVDTGRATISQPLTVNQNIELFNYESESWEAVDSRVASIRRDGDAVEVAMTGDLSRFVDPNTLCVEARIRFVPSRVANFTSDTDQFSWTIFP